MKLQEVFTQLSYGELSQLALGGTVAGQINADNYDRIVVHINLGLTALYKRFPLKEGYLQIELHPDRTNYPLTSKFAVSSRASREPVRYIKDSTAAPFKDDILKVERVYASTKYEFGMNDLTDPFSLRTPTSTTLVVPQSIVNPPVELDDQLRTATLDVYYRANHPQIMLEGADLDPEAVELELPDTHLQPLLYFVASRVHRPNGVTDQTNMGNDFLQMYENACLEIENKNLRVDNVSTSERLTRNGWV